LRIPGISGYGGMRHVKIGLVYVAFNLQKPPRSNQHKIEGRRLVRLGVSWGGPAINLAAVRGHRR
jgi:hypothetical protein